MRKDYKMTIRHIPTAHERIPSIAQALFRPLLLLILLFSHSSIFATEVQLDEIVATGTRLKYKQSLFPVNVAVFDETDFESNNPPVLSNAFEHIPGVDVSRSGGVGGVTSVFVRGGDPNFVVVFRDGVKANDSTNNRGGGYDFSQANIADIDRIEIAKGALSAVYGSDALGGAINLISKSPTDSKFALFAGEIGGRSYHRISASANLPLTEKLALIANTSTLNDEQPTARSSIRIDSISSTLAVAATPRLNLLFRAKKSRAEAQSFAEFSGGYQSGFDLDTESRIGNEAIMSMDAEYAFHGKWIAKTSLNHMSNTADIESPGVESTGPDGIPPNITSTDLFRTRGSFLLAYEQSENLNGTMGVDFEKENGRTDGQLLFSPDSVVDLSFDIKRRSIGAFAEARLQINRIAMLSGSIRSDNYDYWPSVVTGRAGVLVRLGLDGLYFRANHGSGHKLPSYYAVGNTIVGNPLLSPEKGRGYDFSLEFRAPDRGRSYFLGWFESKYYNLIDFDPEIFKLVNREIIIARGLEFEVEQAIGKQIRLNAHATSIDYRNEFGSADLLSRPNWRAGASVYWTPHENLTVFISNLFVGEKKDASIPTGIIELSSYSRMDINLRWKPSAKHVVTVSLDNVFDNYYQQAVGIPSPARRLRIGFELLLSD